MTTQSAVPLSDIEISQQASLRPIVELARDRLGIPADAIVPYGRTKAKISLDYLAGLRDPAPTAS